MLNTQTNGTTIPEEEGFDVRPLYLQVSDRLRARIEKGVWPIGLRLPNEYTLGKELKVASGTVRKALEALEADHLIIRRQGDGTYINDREAFESKRMETCLDRSASIIQQALDEAKVNTTHAARKCLKKHFAQALFDAGYPKPEKTES